MKRVQKYDHNHEKIKVLAVSNQNLQMLRISKGRRHSEQGGTRKKYFDFVSQIFCSEELFDRKCELFDRFSGGIKNDANYSPR